MDKTFLMRLFILYWKLLCDCTVLKTFSKEIISNKEQMLKTNSEGMYETLESTVEMQLMMKFYMPESVCLHLKVLLTKNHFHFFFVFQNYITEPVSDRSFKPSFQKDTCLFRLKFS